MRRVKADDGYIPAADLRTCLLMGDHAVPSVSINPDEHYWIVPDRQHAQAQAHSGQASAVRNCPKMIRKLFSRSERASMRRDRADIFARDVTRAIVSVPRTPGRMLPDGIDKSAVFTSLFAAVVLFATALEVILFGAAFVLALLVLMVTAPLA